MNAKLEDAASPVSPPEPPKAPLDADARVARALVIAPIGTILTFLIMARSGHMPFAVPVVTFLMMAVTWSVLDALAVTARGTETTHEVQASALAVPMFRLVGTFGAFVATLFLTSRGLLPSAIAGFLLAAEAIGVFAFGFEFLVALGPLAVDESGKPRELRDRHGFWLMVVGSVLYFPGLGWASLWDPWETHYGEVAREIIQRDDWISTWWSWEGWFYSKPILGQWVQALAMSALGVSTAPDKVLWDADAQRFLHPEWVVRTPIVLMALVAMYMLYKGVARHAGRRPALLGGLVLATSPQWWMLSHQTMTDMPLVAALCVAFGLVLLGIKESDDAEVTNYSIRFAGRKAGIDFSGWTLAMGAIVGIVLPQVLYLFSRNLEFVFGGEFGFRPHADEFKAGSPGNWDLPGNPKFAEGHVTVNLEPSVQALIWLALLILIVSLQLRERKRSHLYYLAAWTMAGVATMAKALLGLGIPACAVFFALLLLRRWKEIPKMQIVSGLAAVVVLSLPWGVAMFVRHGTAFTDELFFHDMFNRVLSHVHDTNDGIDTSFRYYIWQAGYALFPWTGVVLFAIVSWLRDDKRDQTLPIILIMWALVTFTLFSMAGTRFHHYIFPAVPPAAMMAGLALDRVMSDTASKQDRLLQAAGFVVAALIVLLISYDLIFPTGGGEAGPATLMRLFTYQYKRAWPSSEQFSDYGTIFGTAAQIFAVLLLGAGVYAWRKYAVYALIGGAMLFTVWGIDIYMPAASNHFGQRAVFEAYYKDREQKLPHKEFSPTDADVVAYMLNWKGENFYTGNHIAQFTGGGAAFTNWVKEKKNKGARLVYVATERNRISAVKGQLQARSVEELTTAATSTQFVMLRAEL